MVISDVGYISNSIFTVGEIFDFWNWDFYLIIKKQTFGGYRFGKLTVEWIPNFKNQLSGEYPISKNMTYLIVCWAGFEIIGELLKISKNHACGLKSLCDFFQNIFEIYVWFHTSLHDFCLLKTFSNFHNVCKDTYI